MVTEYTKEWIRQWMSPGIILGVLGWIFLLGVASFRLQSLEGKVIDLQGEVRSANMSNQTSAIELVRYQERVQSLASRIAILEEFKTNQEAANVRVFSGLSKLGG